MKVRRLLALFLLFALSSYSSAPHKEGLGSELSGLSDAERIFFFFEARYLNRLFQDEAITLVDVRTVYAAHSLWLAEREAESKRPPEFSKIGADADFAREQYVRTRVMHVPDDLRGRDMRWAYLTGAQLNRADMSGTGDKATIDPAGKPQFGIDLTRSNLIGADLPGINGKETLLRSALLIGADFTGADLSGAKLYNSDLRWANLSANLKGADFGRSNVAGAIFDAVSGGLPDIPAFASATGIESLTYRTSPVSLIELRTALRSAGYEQQSKAVTAAIMRTERRNTAKGSMAGMLQSAFSFVAFDATSGYGLYPFRPLLILIALIGPFAALYTLAMLRPGFSGIYANRPKDAVQGKPLDRWILLRHRYNGLRGAIRTVRVALWFSTISAFRVGFREFSVGDWLTRLQSREYIMVGRGWVRTFSGIQSLLSLLLLALSVLSFFGRPFG